MSDREPGSLPDGAGATLIPAYLARQRWFAGAETPQPGRGPTWSAAGELWAGDGGRPPALACRRRRSEARATSC